MEVQCAIQEKEEGRKAIKIHYFIKLVKIKYIFIITFDILEL